MNINVYNEIINDNKMKNRALSRTNINVEALKTRIEKVHIEPKDFAKIYGNELLLILMNYIVQKYHKSYRVLSFPDGVERLYFYIEPENDLKNRLAAVHIDKARYYLSREVLESTDSLSAIINYTLTGFEEVEKQVLKALEKVKINQSSESDAEKVMTIYQIVAVGSCLGYFNVILDEYLLQNVEKFMMKYFNTKQFLLKFANGFCKIDIQNGDLILQNRIVKFENWSNYSVGKGLEYLAKVIEDSKVRVLSIEVQVGGFSGRSFNVQIDIDRKIAVYTSYGFGFSKIANKEIPLNEEVVNEFIYKLYELNILGWKRHYQPKQPVMDGTAWSIRMTTDKGDLESDGDNAYPRTWSKFCKSIEALTMEEFR